MRQRRSSRDSLDALVLALGPGPWTRRDLTSYGWTVEQVRSAEAAGRLVRLHRGVYRATLPDPNAPLKGALLRAGNGCVVSHASAGQVEDLWMPVGRSALIHLTRSGAIERTDRGVRLHGSRLPSAFVTTVDDMPVTTVARTAVDMARGLPLPEAMLVVDSAARVLIAESGADLRMLRSTQHRLELLPLALGPLGEAFDSVRTWPGSVVVRGAIDLVDPASESPHESRSRGWMHEARMPMPLTAFRVHGASGTGYVSEFAWPDKLVLGEVDGFAKYGDTADQVGRSLRSERRRQADLEDAGWRVVRWTTADDRRTVLRRLGRALR